MLRLLHACASPTSHPEVSEALQPQGWDRATLYRNLADLTQVGLLRRVDVGDHVWRFELAAANHTDEHPHFLCTACGEVSCLPELDLSNSGLPVSVRQGKAEIQLRGLCDACFA